ncbi:MAG: hypothetical protein WBF47_15125, partial [Xanthobacteraceae bacterium]
ITTIKLARILDAVRYTIVSDSKQGKWKALRGRLAQLHSATTRQASNLEAATDASIVAEASPLLTVNISMFYDKNVYRRSVAIGFVIGRCPEPSPRR